MGTVRTFSSVQPQLSPILLMPQPGNAQEVADLRTVLVDTGAIVDAGFGDSFVFQYFPESLDDKKSNKYAEIEVPGGSHPLYQWVSGGGRTISFKALFSQERISPSPQGDPVKDRHCIDINAALAFLRYFYYPSYQKGTVLKVLPPQRLWLIIPGTMLGGNVARFSCFMSDFGYQITEWHGRGVPRLAEVDLQFTETVQSRTNGVSFVGRELYKTVKNDYKSPNTQRTYRFG